MLRMNEGDMRTDPTRSRRIELVMGSGFNKTEATIAHDAAADGVSAALDAAQAAVDDINDPQMKAVVQGLLLKMLIANTTAMLEVMGLEALFQALALPR